MAMTVTTYDARSAYGARAWPVIADREPATDVCVAHRRPHVAQAPTVATYRRRRLGVLLAAVTMALALVPAASRAAAAFRDVPASVSERRPAPVTTPSVAGAAYVVQPGETLWSIARRLQPEGDLRALVHVLVRVNGGSSHLEVGQRLALP
jgi:LysM domain-containing protein